MLATGAGTDSTAAITRCLQNGKLTYTDLSCPADATATPFTGQAAAPNDPEAAQRRHAADKQKLQQIELDNARLAKEQQHQQRIAAQQARLVQHQHYRCKKLDAKRKAAQQQRSEIKAAGNKKQAERARLLAEQAEDDYALHCPAI